MIKLSEKNYYSIMGHDLSGSKLEALYKLIEKKGSLVESNKIDSLNGKKALQISNTDYVTIIRTGGKSFYPCSIKIVIFTKLDKHETGRN